MPFQRPSPLNLIPAQFTLSGVRMPMPRQRPMGGRPMMPQAPPFPGAPPAAGARARQQAPSQLQQGGFSALANGQGTFPPQPGMPQGNGFQIGPLGQGPVTPSMIAQPRGIAPSGQMAQGALPPQGPSALQQGLGLSRGILGLGRQGASLGQLALGPGAASQALGQFGAGAGALGGVLGLTQAITGEGDPGNRAFQGLQSGLSLARNAAQLLGPSAGGTALTAAEFAALGYTAAEVAAMGGAQLATAAIAADIAAAGTGVGLTAGAGGGLAAGLGVASAAALPILGPIALSQIVPMLAGGSQANLSDIFTGGGRVIPHGERERRSVRDIGMNVFGGHPMGEAATLEAQPRDRPVPEWGTGQLFARPSVLQDYLYQAETPEDLMGALSGGLPNNTRVSIPLDLVGPGGESVALKGTTMNFDELVSRLRGGWTLKANTQIGVSAEKKAGLNAAAEQAIMAQIRAVLALQQGNEQPMEAIGYRAYKRAVAGVGKAHGENIQRQIAAQRLANPQQETFSLGGSPLTSPDLYDLLGSRLHVGTSIQQGA